MDKMSEINGFRLNAKRDQMRSDSRIKVTRIVGDSRNHSLAILEDTERLIKYSAKLINLKL